MGREGLWEGDAAQALVADAPRVPTSGPSTCSYHQPTNTTNLAGPNLHNARAAGTCTGRPYGAHTTLSVGPNPAHTLLFRKFANT